MPITEKQIVELESFFAKTKLPKEVTLDAGSKVNDVQQFVKSHLNVLRYNLDKPIYEVFYLRLLKLQELIS